MAVRWWELTRELATIGGALAGYAWLAVLTTRVRVLKRRLGAHICREPHRHRPPGHAEAPGRIDAAQILRREAATLRPGQPAVARAPSPTTEVTQPVPALRTGPDDREAGHRC